MVTMEGENPGLVKTQEPKQNKTIKWESINFSPLPLNAASWAAKRFNVLQKYDISILKTTQHATNTCAHDADSREVSFTFCVFPTECLTAEVCACVCLCVFIVQSRLEGLFYFFLGYLLSFAQSPPSPQVSSLCCAKSAATMVQKHKHVKHMQQKCAARDNCSNHRN